MKNANSKDNGGTIALNKKARHDYFIQDRYEAGIALQGWEVKSLRAGKCQLVDSYEKIKNGDSEVLYEEAPQKTLVAFTDSVPHSGVNRYFARIEFLNGFQLRSDTLAVYFTGASNRLIFPNPVSGSATLSVLSQTPDEATFELFDALGRHILEQNLSMPRVDILLPSLPPGCYQWRIQTERGERSETGGVVVAGKR